MLQAATQGPELHDIHLPAPPSWWPPAPGWWLLAILAIALCIFLFLYFYRMRQRRLRRRALLAEFERAASSEADAPALAAALSAFLRRLAIRTTPSAATLAGEAWLAHLDARLGGEEFSNGVGRALIEAPYRPQAAFDAPALIALARRTVKKMSADDRFVGVRFIEPSFSVLPGSRAGRDESRPYQETIADV